MEGESTELGKGWQQSTQPTTEANSESENAATNSDKPVPPDPFVRCERCGEISLNAHSEGNCPAEQISPTAEGSPTLEHRTKLLDVDDGDPNDLVVLSQNQYAQSYHVVENPEALSTVPDGGRVRLPPDVSEQVDTACSADKKNTSGWVLSTRRGEWARVACHPCIECHGIDAGKLFGDGQ